MSKNLINVNVRLEEGLKKRLTIFAAQSGAKIQELIASFIQEGLDKAEKTSKK